MSDPFVMTDAEREATRPIYPSSRRHSPVKRRQIVIENLPTYEGSRAFTAAQLGALVTEVAAIAVTETEDRLARETEFLAADPIGDAVVKDIIRDAEGRITAIVEKTVPVKGR